MPKTMIQIILRNIYIILISNKQYTPKHNKCEEQNRDLQYLSKRRMINTNSLAALWDFCIFTESEIMYRMYRGRKRPGLEVFTSYSVDIIRYD